MILSLCRVLEVVLYFSKGFSEASAEESAVVEALQPFGMTGLLLGIRVQLVVFCTVIEVQIVFETLLALVTSQLAIAGQLERKIHSQRIGLFLGSRGQRWFGQRLFSR